MRHFLKRLLKRLQAFLRGVFGDREPSQRPPHIASTVDSDPPSAPISTLDEQPNSQYLAPSQPESLIDQQFEAESKPDPATTSATPSQLSGSQYPPLPRKELRLEKPFESGLNPSARNSEWQKARKDFTSSSVKQDNHQSHGSQPNSSRSASNLPANQSQSSKRPYLSYSTSDLAQLAEAEWHNVQILNKIRYELQFRTRRRAKELRDRIEQRLTQLPNSSFNWPKTTANPGHQPFPQQVFKQTEGLLSHCGYRVGAKGLPEPQRRRILDDIYRQPLPPMDDTAYEYEWGDPQTAQRLQKLAETIAALTRNARRRNNPNLRIAINDWEADLAYLKQNYYDGRFSFHWPRTS